MSEELTVEECKRIISEGRQQLTAAQERIAELENELRKAYDAQGIKAEELTKRDVLIRELYDNLWLRVPRCADAFAEQMREVGIEV